MLAPLSVSRAICCGRAAYLCYQSPLLNIMTKQNSKNNIHPAALQMRKADKLFMYYQLKKLGLSGRVCRRKSLGVLRKNVFYRWCCEMGRSLGLPLACQSCLSWWHRVTQGWGPTKTNSSSPKLNPEPDKLWCSSA